MHSVGIIGFGRFGKILSNILQRGFDIKIYDKNPNLKLTNVKFVSLDEIVQEKNIFIAVPIRNFKDIIKNIAPKLNNTTIIDVCSVKMEPVKIMKSFLPQNAGIIATHPLFGPDSFNINNNLKMMMNNTRDSYNQFKFWKNYFISQDINIIEMDPSEHDILASKTQGVTHFLGRVLKEFGISKTKIDTQGFSELLDLVNQTCNDSWELFSDLQLYNPYTNSVIEKLKKSTNEVSTKLIKGKK
tara:strand:+ start:15259 stop:15984 length:726 start_codon:yes stop_codon:yes gene_type:complete